MGRDLLYKPQVLYVPDEESQADGKKAKDAKKKAKVQKGRELGQVGGSVAKQIAKGNKASGTKAHKHQYFNNDISGVKQANFNKGGLKALRGSKEATDLRKIVLPRGSLDIDHPQPEILKGALDLMGGLDGFNNDLAGLLNRQGAWAKSQGMTVEKLKERMAQLEAMVDLRKAALGRMANGKSEAPITSVTLLHAASSAGTALDQVDDVASAGTELIGDTAEQASGMHKRLAKMFGIKPG